MDAVLEKGTTIMAWEWVGECFGKGRMDVRQRSRGLRGNLEWKSVDAYFVADHTLLQVCHLVAAVLEKGTTTLALEGCGSASGEERMGVRQRSRGVGGNL